MTQPKSGATAGATSPIHLDHGRKTREIFPTERTRKQVSLLRREMLFGGVEMAVQHSAEHKRRKTAASPSHGKGKMSSETRAMHPWMAFL